MSAPTFPEPLASPASAVGLRNDNVLAATEVRVFGKERRVSLALCGVIAFIAVLALIGWRFHAELLASSHLGFIPMAPLTAIAFLLSTSAIAIYPRGASGRWISAVLGFSVMMLGCAMIADFCLTWDIGIEKILVADPGQFGLVKKGRMSPITAGGFILAGSAILLVSRSWLRRFAGFPIVALICLAAAICLGYLYGTPLLYGGGIIPVALTTALAFLLLCVSLLLETGAEHWPLRVLVGDSARSLLLRWFLPVIAVLMIVQGLIAVRLLEHSRVNPAVVTGISAVCALAIVCIFISQLARIVGGRIDRAETERNSAKAELEALNAALEHRIAERTLDLRQKNEQIEEELSMARELQLALLPREFPSVPDTAAPKDSALHFFTFYYPTGKVSGDFFNVFPAGENCVGIFVCDVMGHGIRAALVTSMMRALMEQGGPRTATPGELLTRLNEGLCSILKQSGITLFATACIAIADVDRREITYANAGHPKPISVRRSAGESDVLGGRVGPALGLFAGSAYPSQTAPLEQGDVLMLFTDGLFEVEAPGGDLYSYERLLESAGKHSRKTPRAILESVVEDVRVFSARTEFEDDVCLIGVEMAGRVS